MVYPLMVLSVILLAGCSNYLDVNTNPNAPTDANMTAALLFPNAAVEVGAIQANTYWSATNGNFVQTGLYFMNMWMGYWGWPGDYAPDATTSSYNITYTYGEAAWDHYYHTLKDLNETQTKAIAEGDPVLAGASMVLSVKLWQELVDIFGDIPYSQAFNTTQYPNPAYDKAQTVYTNLQASLDTAIVYLNKTALSSFSTTDVVFSGKTTLWIKFANTLKLRLLIRQSETTYATTAPTAEIAKIVANGGCLGAGQSASVNPGFMNSDGKQSPFYAAYGLTAEGAAASATAVANSFFASLLQNNGDTARLYRYYKPVNGAIASTTFGATSGNTYSANCSENGLGLAGSATQNQWILTSFESLFLQAEAIARGWMTGNAQTAYQNAVTESFNWLGVTNYTTTAASYLANSSIANWSNAGTTTTSQVSFIATQKYLSLCAVDALEAWSDYRRLNKYSPSIIPASVTSSTGKTYYLLSVYPGRGSNPIPLRLLYPQSEYTTNAANTPIEITGDEFTSKIFWQP